MEHTSGTAAPRSPSNPRVPLSVIVAYCLPTVGSGFMFLLVSLYLMKFATDVLLIAPAVMGTIFGLSRIWDAISDPVAGYLSDRTQHRAGRRRPWIFVSMFPIGLAYWMAWSPPEGITGGALTAWMTVGVFGFYSAMTVFVVPHLSLGAELTADHHERSRIFGFRHVGWTVGSIFALLGMARLLEAESVSIEASRATAAQLAVAAGIVTAAMLGFAAFRLRERPDFQGRGADKPFAAFSDVWANPHARLLLTVTLVENLGAATIGVLTLYVADYVIGAGHLAPIVILCYMVPSVALVPLWIPISRRVGKRRLWMGGQLLTSLSFGGMFFLGAGDVYPMAALAVSAGVAAGVGGTLSPSLQADVIDYDEYQTRERKEGAYYSAWSFVYKSAYGLTLMLTGYVLQMSGFEPNVEQTDTVKLALRTLYGGFPFVCYLGGALLLRNYRLDEGEHARIRDALDARDSER
ncbi:MAG: hypothetical protein GY723_10290 [bacterium]|nr:hypothetical protein [bacterium]